MKLLLASTVLGVTLLVQGTWAPSVQAQHDEHHPAPSPPAPGNVTQPNLIPQPGWLSPVMDSALYRLLLFELLEVRPSGGGSGEWDVYGWYGGDYNRIWLKSEGSIGLRGSTEAEFQVLYGRLISPFFDFQAGLRVDRRWRESGESGLVQAVIGVQGLAPYLFDLEPALFISPYGDLSVRLTASRAWLLTQRTYLDTRVETNAALRRIDALDLGAGLSDLDLGLRLIHQIRRELAPYLGVSWHTRFGETAAMAGQEARAGLSVTAGVRLWY